MLDCALWLVRVSRDGASEGACRCEYRLAFLFSLHAAGGIGPAGADILDVVDYGNGSVPGEDKVAVHAVYGKIFRDSALGG